MHTKDTQFADWLMWFTRDESSLQASQPFRCLDGRVASNGKYAVFTRDGGPAVDSTYRQTLEAVMSVKKPGVTLPFAEFRAMVGECQHPAMEICPKCGGEKWVEHDCDCELCEVEKERCGYCEQTGKALSEPEKRAVTFWGTAFDANQVAYVLEHVPAADQVTVYVVPGDANILHIVAEDWHAVVCGLDVNVTTRLPEVMGAGVR